MTTHKAKTRMLASAAIAAAFCTAHPAVAQDRAQPSGAAPANDTSSSADIVVTAQKREERLLDVPIPVSTLPAESLRARGQFQLQDYFTRIPGLNITNTGTYGGSVPSIRGITSGVFNDGVVAVVVDGVPFGTTGAQGPGEVVPEIDPSELQRVEVLRGPQSTLYGASSLGGLIQFVTIDPSTDGFHGRVQAGISGVENGGRAGYNVSGSVNIPLSSWFAIRANAFTHYDPGYIDDPVHGLSNVNSGRVSGGRLSALIRLSPDWTVRLNALYEHSQLDGASYVNLLPGNTAIVDLTHSTPPGSGGYDKTMRVYSMLVNGQVGGVNFASITAYTDIHNIYHFDQSPTLGPSANAFFPGTFGAAATQRLTTRKFTQEVRFTVPVGEHINWLLGGFFNDERIPQDDVINAVNATTGAVVGRLAFLQLPSTYREVAGFSDLTVRFGPRFDIQLGGRVSSNHQTLNQSNIGPVIATGTLPTQRSQETSFTFLVTPRWHITDDVMAYARIASGYRPGGPNSNTALGVPVSFAADRTINYEVGIKGRLIDRILTFDVSAYHIDWKNFVITVREPTLSGSFKVNGGNARSDGVDVALTLRPWRGFTATGWVAYNVAELSQAFPATSTVRGNDGDRLPFSSRFSSNLSLEQRFPLGGAWEASFGGDMSYVGQRLGVFNATNVRQVFPSFTKFDLEAGVHNGPWSVTAYVNNVTDRRALINGGAGNIYPNTFAYITPRTFGLNVARTF